MFCFRYLFNGFLIPIIMNSYQRILVPGLLILLVSGISAQDKKALTVDDLMKFRRIESPSISDEGKWIVYATRPDRGDPEVLVCSTDGKKQYTIERGEKPEISGDGNWVAAIQAVPAIEKLKSKKDDELKQGLVLLNTLSGEQEVIERVSSFSFTNDSRWLAYQNYQEEEKKDTSRVEGEKKPSKTPSRKDPGTMLVLRSLGSDKGLEYSFVKDYSIDSTSTYLAYCVSDTSGAGNGIYIVNLMQPDEGPVTAYADTNAWGDPLSWTRRTHTLAFIAGKLNNEDKRDEAGLYLWSPGKNTAELALDDSVLASGWKVYHQNYLSWTKDGERLFVGIKPASEIIPDEEEDKDTMPDLFDTEKILAERELDIWHWNDPLIIPNQKVLWNRVKDRTYTGVYYPVSKSFVQLADTLVPDFRVPENPVRGLVSSNLPYSKKITWDTRLTDVYLVDLKTGERRMILEEFRGNPNLSPDGQKVVYYREGDWYLLDAESLLTINLTAALSQSYGISFSDEDHDYPEPAPGYGTGGWVNGSQAILIYDKYDIWQFSSDGSQPVCLTGGKGRAEKYQFRIRDLDPESEDLRNGQKVLVEAYHDLKKFTAVYSLTIGKVGTTQLAEEAGKFSLISKAKNEDRILFTRESYTEFPDLWVSKSDFKKPLKLTDVNPQVSEFAWGKAELVSWSNMDGRFMQGVLIRPGNYQAGKKYPVLVYYYRFSSDFVITQTDMFACAIAGAPVSNMTSAYSGIRLESGLARQMQYEKSQSRIGGSLWEYPERYIENSPVFFADRINTPLLIQFGDVDDAVPWQQGIELYLAMRRLEKDCVFLQYRGEPHHLKTYANKLDYTLKFKAYLDHYCKGAPAPEWLSRGVPYLGK